MFVPFIQTPNINGARQNSKVYTEVRSERIKIWKYIVSF